MALLHIDGFDHYAAPGDDTTADTAIRSAGYFNLDNANTAKVGVSAQTRTGIGYSMYNGGLGDTIGVGLKYDAVSGMVAGFALMVQKLKEGLALAQFRSPTGVIVVMGVNRDGSVYAHNGNYTPSPDGGNTAARSRAGVISPNVWNYVEFKVVVDKSGYIGIRVNEEVVLWLTQDTTTAGTQVNQFGFLARVQAEYGVNFPWVYFDDFYLLSTDNTTFGDFLGDRTVVTRMPISDVGPNSMQVTGKVNHYEAVAEIPPDGDTTYLSGDTLGQEETFGLGALPATTIEVTAVMTAGQMKQEAGGSTQAVLTAHLNQHDAETGLLYPSTTYGYRNHIMTTAPDGSNWTKDKADALTIGVRIAQ